MLSKGLPTLYDQVLRLLPEWAHPMTGLDLAILFSAKFIVMLALTSPPTRPWRLFRALVIAPLTASMFLYFGMVPRQKCWEDQWGNTCITMYLAIHAFELLVFFPAEEYSYRVLPTLKHSAAKSDKSDGLAGSARAIGPEGKGPSFELGSLEPQVGWRVEPIPPAWTWAKFWWAHSLWWSLRGIGWNFAPSLPQSSLQDPYKAGSSRRRFVYVRLRRYLIGWIITDLLRSYMNLSSVSTFFGGQEGAPRYTDLTQFQRAIYSICVVTRLALGMDRTHVPIGVGIVILGGIFGWETELCSPYGWTPLFGGITDIWNHPGLSQMWSKNWHHYFRVWLWKFGWIGLGEKILRIKPSGPDIKGPPPHLVAQMGSVAPNTSSSSSSPRASGQVSPSHPLPTVPVQRKRYIRVGDLIKSFCVFGLTGLIHDYAYFFVLLHTRPGKNWKWTDAMVTTPFFIIQPVGIALEAAVKSHWRAWKAKNRSGWKVSGEPKEVVFLERFVGFIWTWTWLGWTAGWYIDGIVQVGNYRRGGDLADFPSLFGGLFWNRWYH